MSFSLSISHGSHPPFEITKFLQVSIVTQYDTANSVVSFYDYLTIGVAGRSPIRLPPIGHSPMAKIRGCIGESTVDFRQLAKFQEIYWRK
jgi:hypothetical protein